MNLRHKKQVKITDMMNKSAPNKQLNQNQSKRGQKTIQTESDMKISIQDNRCSTKSRNGKNQAAQIQDSKLVNNTKKRKLADFERGAEEEHKLNDSNKSQLRRNSRARHPRTQNQQTFVQIQSNHKNPSLLKESEEKMMLSDLAVLSNAQPKSKRMRTNQDVHNEKDQFTLREQNLAKNGQADKFQPNSTATAINVQKPPQASMSRGRNLGVKKVLSTFVEDEQPKQKAHVQEEKNEILDSKKRGRRPKAVVAFDEAIQEKENEIIKSQKCLRVEEEPIRAKSKQTRGKANSKAQKILTIEISDDSSDDHQQQSKKSLKKSRRSLSADSKAPQPTTIIPPNNSQYFEKSIHDLRKLKGHNIGKIDTQKAIVVFNDQEMMKKTQNIKLMEQQLINQEPSEQEMEYRRGAVDFFVNNEENKKHHQYLKKRKETVRKELIESDGLYEVYKQWQPMKQYAEKGKQIFHQGRK